jgi:hypothetical protein
MMVSMKTVVFLEGKAEKEMLDGVLPRVGVINYQTVVFEGKQDLARQLPRKLRGWLEPNVNFIVLRDKDKENCKTVKNMLKQICCDAGKPETIVRIACHQLESWYLGDLQAVENALEVSGLGKQQQKAKYRTPDKLLNASEELKNITNKKYAKLSGSRAIGKIMSVNANENKSHSFNVFLDSLLRIAAYAN